MVTITIKLNDWITGLVINETIRLKEGKIDWFVDMLAKANPDSSVTVTWGKDNFLVTEPMNCVKESEDVKGGILEFENWSSKWYNV